jgi:hypothetical protein
MPVVRMETSIRAPFERCFDLARDVELHLRSTKPTRASGVSITTTSRRSASGPTLKSDEFDYEAPLGGSGCWPTVYS